MATPEPTASVRPLVLVVDDDDRNRALLRAILESQYDVIDASDAHGALSAVADHAVDLVLLDVMMPGVSGLEACAQIKAYHRGAFLPVLLVTALDQREDRHRGLEAGADDYLTKPIDRREILLRVRAFLKLREQDQLIRRQFEALRDLDALKDDLVSLIVHDLRNPLSSVLALLQVMSGAPHQDPETTEDISYALSAATRLKSTIDDLLHVRQLEEGKLTLDRQQQSLEAIASAAIETLRGAAMERNVKLNLTLDGSDSRIHVDGKLLQRALENLLSNAIKYSPSSASVDLRICADDRACVLEVADRGVGIPDSVKASLFTKYGGLRHGEARDPRRGCGLGLYLVRLVVDAHRGSVYVRDREDGGSIFELTLHREVV